MVRRLSLGGVIIATAVLSYSVLRDRAVSIGFPEWASWLYPVGLDALILGGSRMWTDDALTPGTRRLAMWVTLVAIAAGVAGFVAEFAPNGWVAVAFACLIPASLAASLVLTSRAAADRRDDTSGPDVPSSEDKTVPVPTTPAKPRAVAAASPAKTRPKTTTARVRPEPNGTVATAAARKWARDRIDAGEDVTGPMVQEAHPAIGRNGSRILREVKKELEEKETDRAEARG